MMLEITITRRRQRQSRNPPGLVAQVLAAFGVASCGGQDAAKQRNTYADQVNRAQNDFAQSFKDLSRRITSTSKATLSVSPHCTSSMKTTRN